MAYDGHHPYPRTARINQILREVISEVIIRLGDRDGRLGLVTVTDVDTSPDIRQAVVFLDSLTQEQRESLDEHRAYIQAQVNAQTRLKRTPKLSFMADPAIAAGESVETALRRLHVEDDES
jgi:ribosome-binding factor A